MKNENVTKFVVLPWRTSRKKSSVTVGEMLDSLKAQLAPIARHDFYLLVACMKAIDDQCAKEWKQLEEQVKKAGSA